MAKIINAVNNMSMHAIIAEHGLVSVNRDELGDALAGVNDRGIAYSLEFFRASKTTLVVPGVEFTANAVKKINAAVISAGCKSAHDALTVVLKMVKPGDGVTFFDAGKVDTYKMLINGRLDWS